MKHTNPNMIQPVLQGIEVGERLTGAAGEMVVDALLLDVERLTTELSTLRVNRFIPSKELAYAQGVIGAYRAATEHIDDRCECGGTLYATGNQCRETGIHETRCTGCDFHDY